MPSDPEKPISSNDVTRRKFIAVAAGVTGAMFIKPSLVHGTAANSAVRVGLLGCGGRGTEDATNLVDTGGARVVALGDMFQDQLDIARKHFDEMQQGKGYAALDASQLFVGPDAYQKIAGSKEVDAIVIATPPYYHPQHLEAVIAAKSVPHFFFFFWPNTGDDGLQMLRVIVGRSRDDDCIHFLGSCNLLVRVGPYKEL